MTPRRLATCALIGLALGGCKEKAELVLGVATDLRARGQLDEVRLSAKRDGVEVVANQWTLADARPGRFELPGSFGLYSREGAESRVDVTIDGYKEGRLIATRPAKLSLVRGKTLFLRLTIVADCRQPDGPACPDGEACVEGACRPQPIDAQALPIYRVDLVDKLPCSSGTQYIVTTTGDPLPVDGAGCAADEVCQEGLCIKRPADEPDPAPPGSWTTEPTPPELAGSTLNGVWGTSDGNDVFAVGSHGTVVHQSGGAGTPWTAEPLPPEDADATLYGVAGAGPDEVFAGGADGGGHGGVWHRVPLGPWVRERLPDGIERVASLWGWGGRWWAIARAANNATHLLRRDVGGAWVTDVVLPPLPDGGAAAELRALGGTSPSDLVVGGARGALFRRGVSGTFAPLAFPDGAAPRELLSIMGVSSSELVLAGRGGLVMRLANGVLSVDDVGLSSDLHAVWASAATDVYVVGDLGQILHRGRDGAWAREASGTRRGLFAVWGSGPRNVYAVGRGGLILHSTGDPNVACTTAAQCATTCANAIFTGAACNATQCEPTTPTSCAGGYQCADGARCRTDCAADADCQSDHFCAADRSCQPRKAQGTTCNDAAGADCQGAGCRVCGDGLFCTDGVCCDKSPAQCGGCQQCSAPTGTCGPVPAGQDPHNTCPASADECQLTACNGAGGCGKPNGTSCGTAACAAAMLTTRSCVDGTCTTNAPAPCPGGSQCNGAGNGCNATCASDNDCTSNYFCDSTGACRLRVAQGGTCNPPVECKTAGCRICQGTFTCADGRCCNRACGGLCEACDVGGSLGTCTTLTSGQPHAGHGTCTNGGSVPCGGSCAGNPTACTNPTVSCRTAQCISTVTLQQPASCSGGSCPAVVQTSCAPFACVGSACLTQCTSNADCAPNHACDTTTMVNRQCKLANGQTCAAGTQCASGTCIDNTCCSTPCTGQCESCANSAGTCNPAPAGQPVGGRMSCGVAPCGGACNGTTRTCTYPAGSIGTCGVTANQTRCENGDLRAANYCMDGNCVLGALSLCDPFSCDVSKNACWGACRDSTYCDAAYYCDPQTSTVCQKDLGQGQRCTDNSWCQAGLYCSSGVCCDTPCPTYVCNGDVLIINTLCARTAGKCTQTDSITCRNCRTDGTQYTCG